VQMGRISLRAGIVVLAAASIAGCASSDTGPTERVAGTSAGSDCITNRGIRDFETLDDQNLVLFGPGNRPYHVTLVTRAINLRSEFTLGIFDRDGRICPFGGDAIIIEGPLTERIPIRSIRALDDDGLEALRVEFGKIEAADVEVTVTEIE